MEGRQQHPDKLHCMSLLLHINEALYTPDKSVFSRILSKTCTLSPQHNSGTWIAIDLLVAPTQFHTFLWKGTTNESRKYYSVGKTQLKTSKGIRLSSVSCSIFMGLILMLKQLNRKWRWKGFVQEAFNGSEEREWSWQKKWRVHAPRHFPTMEECWLYCHGDCPWLLWEQQHK